MCDALEVPEIPKDPRFKASRDRVLHNKELDPPLAAAVGRFTLDQLMTRFIECEAAAATSFHDVNQPIPAGSPMCC